MRQPFEGFPSGVQQTPVPSPLLGPLLAEIDDIGELKVALRAVALVGAKKGFPRYLTLPELAADPVLSRNAVAGSVEQAVKRAIARGILLPWGVQQDGRTQVLLFINDESGRRGLESVRKGAPVVAAGPVPEAPSARSTVYELYEQNIGLITPLIAEELKEAERDYPAEWLVDAFREAVSRNKRSWRYVARILERWALEGRGTELSKAGEHGEPGGHSQTLEPKEYLRRYGRLARE